jgi:hypothetical protein
MTKKATKNNMQLIIVLEVASCPCQGVTCLLINAIKFVSQFWHVDGFLQVLGVSSNNITEILLKVELKHSYS